MSDQQNPQQEVTLFEMIGGAGTVRRIVEAFYPKVQEHPLIGPLFPEDIEPVMEKQYLFLTQFFGGPPLFSEQYGHPMMRARHMPFEITPQRADAWLDCMRQALTEIGMESELRELLLQRLQGPAYHFVNTDG
ncbi:MAG: hemoglobin [Paenibacillus sp.]|jgi:hemoglobin|nr:hemoglobin [Paenibacillus sp.]